MRPVPQSVAESVQRSVGALVAYRSDIQQYGVTEFWTEARAGAGDCEDFALTKRRWLLDAGGDLEALRLVMCRTETGELHVVLVVTTEIGDVVLDNLRRGLATRQQLPYRWLAIEELGQWYTVE